MVYIKPIDYVLLLFYSVVFFFIFKLKGKKYISTGLYQYFITAFWLRIIGSAFYASVVQFYYGYGDSFTFFKGSNFIRSVIASENNSIFPFFYSGETLSRLFSITEGGDGYLESGLSVDSNLLVMKISAALSYISFNSYIVVSAFFGVFAFLGIWKLFCVFTEITNNKSNRLLALFILYLPSICFWGSGLIKDSICLGALCFSVSIIYKLFIKKQFSIFDLIQLLLFLYLLFTIKSYIAGGLIFSILIVLIITAINKIQNKLLKLTSSIGLILIGWLFFSFTVSNYIETLLDESKAYIETFKNSYSNAELEDDRSLASFTGEDFDMSISNLIVQSPLVFFGTLFRPYIWETRKPIMLLSAAETMIGFLFALFLLFKGKVYRFFYYIITDELLLFCMIFTIVITLIVGFTTFNFGTLVRYRIPVLPFFYFLLISVYQKQSAKNIFISTAK